MSDRFATLLLIGGAVFLASPRPARAQQCFVNWDCRGSQGCAQVYGASVGSRPVDSCNGFVQRDQVSNCTCGGVEQRAPRFVTPEAAVTSAHLAGGLLGVLAGSFLKSPNEQNFWLEGAAEGVGVLGFAVLAFNMDKFSTPVAVTVGALDGALIGGGYGHYRSIEFIPQGATANDEVSQTLTGAAIGAAVGATVSFAVRTLTTSPTMQRLAPSNLLLDATPHRLFVTVHW